MKRKKQQEERPHQGFPVERLDLFHFIDSLPVGVLLMDLSRRTIAINRPLESLVGYSRQAVFGVQGEYVLRSSLRKEGDPVGTVLASGEPLAIEGNIINLSRKMVPVRFTLSPLRMTRGEPSGLIVVVEDISLLKDLDEKIHGFSGQGKIIGHSRKMQEIFELLPIAARTDASMLITGETGTGKDLVAELVHKASKRSRQPFIKVNCGALPESLLESELFGHVRGAFTGAERDKPGMFRLAHGGTIFLTEIGDLPLPLQVKLLTVLDDKEFFPVGGEKKVRVDVRIIAATHRDLSERARDGSFREDLFYRLNVLRLHLPALREREDDFRLLLDHFLRDFAKGLHKKIKGFSPACLDILSAYPFPGNVRELRNIVEYAVNICPGETILPEHLPQSIFSAPAGPLPLIGRTVVKARNDKPAAGETLPEKNASFPKGGWRAREREMILDALTATGGGRTEAARLLGWSRSKLWRKIKQHGLE